MPSFDIVSQVNSMEIENAVNIPKKELANRFDFKGTKAEITLDKNEIKLSAEDQFKINALTEILLGKLPHTTPATLIELHQSLLLKFDERLPNRHATHPKLRRQTVLRHGCPGSEFACNNGPPEPGRGVFSRGRFGRQDLIISQ